MSYFAFGNLAASVPRVFDTTPCLTTQDAYENCVAESGIRHMEVIHPNWPSIFPRLLTDGKLTDESINDNHELKPLPEKFHAPIPKKVKQFLWECEYERFVFKACLREVIELKRTPKHTSWNTAEVANIQLN